jgi:hypothetical protein
MAIPIAIYGLRPVDSDRFQPESVPLTFVKLNATINTFISVVNITQFYKNRGDTPIECEYVFPLNDNGVLTRLAVQFDDGRELTAQVDEKKEAEDRYNQAITSGHSAVLARTNEPDRMILNIGNLPPNGRAKVTVIYTSPLTVVNEQWKFFIPVAMTPLYNLDSSFEDQDSEVTDLTLVKAENCPYTIGFTIQIQSGSEIQELKSLNHQIDIEYLENRTKATVTLAQGTTYKPDRNFILTFYTSEAYSPKAISECNDGEFTSMLSFIPKFLEEGETEDDIEGSGEYIFILDRSGSMNGERIAMATKAAVLFLKSLPADSKFNIISFGSGFSSMFEGSVTYNRENMNRAINEVSRFGADMGGTEILEPINHVLGQDTDPQYPKSIFLLTDGQVSSPDKVVKLVAENSAKARVHTIGIGEGVSTYLIKDVAKAGKGTFSFVSKNEDLISTVTAALRRTILPAMTRWTLNLDADIVPNPSTLPTMYFNEPFVIFARTPHKINQASIKAYNTKTREYETFDILPEDYHTIIGDNLEKLWHKHKMRELELEISRGKNELKQSVIDISLKYQIPSKYTAYIAVEQRPDPVSGESQYVKIPISLTSDADQDSSDEGLRVHYSMQSSPRSYGVARLRRRSAVPLYHSGSSNSSSRSREGPSPKRRCAVPLSHSGSSSSSPGSLGGPSPKRWCGVPLSDSGFEDSPRPGYDRNMEEGVKECSFVGTVDIVSLPYSKAEPIAQEPIVVGYMIIVTLQEPQGFWELSSLSGVVSVPVKPHEFESIADSDQVWATLIALAYLEKNYSDKIDDWVLVQRKAKRWLKNNGVGDSLFELTTRLVQDA